MAAHNRGFTLVEVSIVMILIGLIAGGILVGRSLIRSAEIGSAQKEMGEYIAAIKVFQDKYQALPGDFFGASSLFANVGDGNGNGLIDVDEQFHAWNHLVSAKLIEKKFTPPPGGGPMMLAGFRVPGENIPASQLTTAGWGLIYVAPGSADLVSTPGDIPASHVLWLGGASSNGGLMDFEQTPVLTSEEAELIDRKLDDNLPGTGKVLAQINMNGAGLQCHLSSSMYNLLVPKNRICALVFKTGF